MVENYPTQLVTQYFQAREAAYLSPMALKALADRRSDDFVIVDVRQVGPNIKWRIPGALVIPATQMQARFSELPKDKLIVLYCWDTWCSLATSAALVLLEHGYRTKELHGGVAAWEALGLPKEAAVSESAVKNFCAC